MTECLYIELVRFFVFIFRALILIRIKETYYEPRGGGGGRSTHVTVLTEFCVIRYRTKYVKRI
jgi:hypothetical protein